MDKEVIAIRENTGYNIIKEKIIRGYYNENRVRKLFAVIASAALMLQAGVSTVSATAAQKSKQAVTISSITSPLLQTVHGRSSAKLRASGLHSDDVKIVSAEWKCPDEFVISGNNIEIRDGKYSYKLTLRANGTLTFDNDLAICYQGINGRYQLNYVIDETDDHTMIVTGAFDNVIVESPLSDKLPCKYKKRLLSRISDDTYFYQLRLRTSEGFSFANSLRFLFDSKPSSYSVFYTYDLPTDRQKLIISGNSDSFNTNAMIGTDKKILPFLRLS